MPSVSSEEVEHQCNQGKNKLLHMSCKSYHPRAWLNVNARLFILPLNTMKELRTINNQHWSMLYRMTRFAAGLRNSEQPGFSRRISSIEKSHNQFHLEPYNRDALRVATLEVQRVWLRRIADDRAVASGTPAGEARRRMRGE